MEAKDFERIERGLLAEEVAYKLIQMIAEGRLRPGDKLPAERALREALGVGRPTIREALRALHMMNILEVRHGDGTYVTSLEPGKLTEPFEVLLSLGSINIEDLFEVRDIVETAAAELAARRTDEEETQRLEGILQEAVKAFHDPERFMRADIELHETIFRVTRNPLLVSMARIVQGFAKASRQITSLLPETRKQVLADHREIVNAIKQNDPEAAREAMRVHLQNIMKAVRLATDAIHDKLIQDFASQRQPRSDAGDA